MLEITNSVERAWWCVGAQKMAGTGCQALTLAMGALGLAFQ